MAFLQRAFRFRITLCLEEQASVRAREQSQIARVRGLQTAQQGPRFIDLALLRQQLGARYLRRKILLARARDFVEPLICRGFILLIQRELGKINVRLARIGARRVFGQPSRTAADNPAPCPAVSSGY